MFEVPCPKCRSLLAFEDQDARRKTKCPLCRYRFTVPQAPVVTEGSWKTFVLWCVALSAVTVLWLAWVTGLLWVLGGVAIVGAIFAGSPAARSAVSKAVHEFRLRQIGGSTCSGDQPPLMLPAEKTAFARIEDPAAQRMDEQASHVPVTIHPIPPVTADTRTMPTDDLIEIQPATTVPRPSVSEPPALSPSRQPASATPRPVSAPLSRVEFLGPDSKMELERGTFCGPLIYATQSTLREPADPSIVEFGLPIARAGIVPGQEPPSWPTYRSFNPSQRSFYLDWVVGGRRRNVPLPYVTLYLYGLERRVLFDAQDHGAVAHELIGLLQAYGTQYSFRRDVAALLWLTIDLSCQVQPVSRATIDAAIAQTQEWNDSLQRHCLAAFAALGCPIPADLARRIAAQDPRTVNSAVVSRHAEMFRSIFDKRFTEIFPGGLRFELAGRSEKVEYLILNPSLSRLPRSETHLTARQRVPLDAVEMDHLVEIWERCVADLKVYDRVHRTSEHGTLTAEMWESLPEISRQDEEHPDTDAWSALLQRAFQEHGRPLVPISELARIRQIEQRGRLTKKQSEQLVSTAGFMQLAIEPDARLTGKTYAWDEVVAVFPRRDATVEDLATYQAASILLRLGMNIAAADGTIADTEIIRITSHLEQQFELSPTAADRLEHLRYALIHSPQSRGQIEKSLREKLHPDQRQIVGEFLVGIAVADGTISPEELKALKKAWQALGLEAKSLDALLQQPDSRTSSPGQPLKLDQDRISQIMLDTQRVAEMLRAAMSVEDEESSEAVLPPVSPPIVAPQVVRSVAESPLATPETSAVVVSEADWSGLPRRYHDFLSHLLGRSVWPRGELDHYARSQQLMLGGALEAINEWTHELHGDWLTSEHDDTIHVQQGLLGEQNC